MTLLDQTQAGAARQSGGAQAQGAEKNVGDSERAVSVAAGAVVALSGISRGTLPGLLMAGVGGMLIHRGVTGRCAAYTSLGINTAQEGSTEEEIAHRGVHVEQALCINKPADELYRFWRDFENLPRIMNHLESVRVTDQRTSHWVAKAPRIAGGSVEWDAEITTDEPNARIAWRSLAGSQVDTAGEIRFSKALGDRGTEVHISMSYVPPGGKLGHWLSAMLGQNPNRMIREDLRNFKRLMEVGEILTIIGQPHGTCTGEGKAYSESEWKPLFR
jgi:uncharacterized membrane protein